MVVGLLLTIHITHDYTLYYVYILSFLLQGFLHSLLLLPHLLGDSKQEGGGQIQPVIT